MVHQKSALSEMEKTELLVKMEPTVEMVFHQKLLLKRTQQMKKETKELESQ
ncbi:hypothetical protein [Dolosigranulum pigrum]|uniref:hypothetical protein n=1 Tax=Dolosigranulum pigrum TaxID=29394 RepID=UPI00155F3179|nr:hypothetical protein [Dolosigranulum pigrum]